MFDGQRDAPAHELQKPTLLQRSEVSAVYVLDAQGPILRQVRIGHRYGDRVEVLAGLDDGERIALDPVATGEWLAKSRRAAGGHG